jgi:dTDP-4-dehydrorhamnose reductase
MKILIISNDLSSNYIKNYFCNENEVFLSNNNLDILFNRDNLTNYLKSLTPDVVINTFEFNNIDQCEINESKAMKYNTISAMNIAYVCNNLSIPMVYISSNHVYGNKNKKPYFETDKCNPINKYGKSKLAAERLIKSLTNKYFIIRPGWIFGCEDDLINNIIKNKYSNIFMCSNEIGSPTYILDLCIAIDKSIHSDFYGTYNCCNPDPIKKSLWVKFIMNKLNLDKEIIEIPSNYVPNSAPRQNYSALSTVLIQNCFNFTPPHWNIRTINAIEDIMNL